MRTVFWLLYGQAHNGSFIFKKNHLKVHIFWLKSIAPFNILQISSSFSSTADNIFSSYLPFYIWQASEVSETLSGVTNGKKKYIYIYVYIYISVCVVRETSL